MAKKKLTPEERAMTFMVKFMPPSDIENTKKGKMTAKALAIRGRLIELHKLCDDLADVVAELKDWQAGVQELLPNDLFERMRQVLDRATQV